MIGELLKAKRKESGKTLVEVANYMRVTSKTVWRWEKEERTPQIGQLLELANFFGCSIVELVQSSESNSECQDPQTAAGGEK